MRLPRPKSKFSDQPKAHAQWSKVAFVPVKCYLIPELSFKGTLLPNNAKDESGEGKYWVLYAYPWGYADNGLNVDETSNFNIEWAVDAEGNPVHLPGIDFVKIYTGVNQYCGWLGETSTEVMGINDLHLLNN